MPRIVQWTTDVNNGFGINPPNIKVVSEDVFDKTLVNRINMLADAIQKRRDAWCDPSVVSLMKDQRSITEHMIVSAETDAPAPAGGAPVSAVTLGMLTMGHDTDRDPPGVLTVHAACARSPEFLENILGILVGGGRLATYGVRQVKINVFDSEVPLYTKYGFQVVGAERGTTDLVFNVPPRGGRHRKSKTVRSKRIRKTRRRNTKQ